MGDYHVHLHPHGPHTGAGPPPGEYPAGHVERYLEVALRRGAQEIAVTEHLYRCVEAAPVLGRFWEREPDADLAAATERFLAEDVTLSLDAYADAVLDARDAGLPVLLGLEVDFFPDTIDDVLDLIEPYPWDVLIGSVHWVGGWSIDHTDSVFEFDRRGVEQSYADYFEIEAQLAASGAVDVLAHVDVVKKMGHRLPTPPLEMYRSVVAAAAESGVAVEVSTAGLYQKAGELYPAPEFLEMFSAAGVPITLASDAHRPEDAARDRSAAIAAARRAGYTERMRFRRRAGWLVPLEDG